MTEELLTEQLNVGLTKSTLTALRAHRRATGIKPVDFARHAITEKLASFAKVAVTTAEAEAIAQARAAGVDPVAALIAAAGRTLEAKRTTA